MSTRRCGFVVGGNCTNTTDWCCHHYNTSLRVVVPPLSSLLRLPVPGGPLALSATTCRISHPRARPENMALRVLVPFIVLVLAVLVPGSFSLLLLDPLDETPAAASCGGWGPDPCAFGSHAVLASNAPYRGGVTPARVWGAAAAHEAITLSGLPAGAVVTPPSPFVASANGTWEVTISAPPSQLSVNITFSGSSGKKVVLDDILFGLSILCSGQSNMDMNVASCYYANETLAGKGAWSDIRIKHSPDGPWSRSDADNATLAAFSAVCYYTALHMKTAIPSMLNTPIGLVQSSVGGTTIESWLSQEALSAAGFPLANATCGVEGCGGQKNCGNYLSLIAPLAPFVFQSLVWYQGSCRSPPLIEARQTGNHGSWPCVRRPHHPLTHCPRCTSTPPPSPPSYPGESNAACSAEASPPWLHGSYARLLPSLVESWRALFRSPFTALVVQLAPYGSEDVTPVLRSSDSLPALRDEQRSVETVSGGGGAYVSPIDLGDDGKSTYTPPSPRHGGLHPRNKTEFGRRVALKWAELEGVLPAGVLASGPVAASATLDGAGAVLVTFTRAGSGALTLMPTADCATSGHVRVGECCQTAGHGFPFELLAGGAWVLANATIVHGGAADSLRLVPLDPTSAQLSGVRYSWQGYPLCVVANEQRLPMAPLLWTLGDKRWAV